MEEDKKTDDQATATQAPDTEQETPAAAVEAPATDAAAEGNAPDAPAETKAVGPGPELQSALEEAIKESETKAEPEKPKEEFPPKPSEAEMKLKMEILNLRYQVKRLETELEQKGREVKQNYDQGIMIRNQFDAHKNRVLKEKAEWLNYGFEPVLKEIIQVADNFERALSHAQEDTDISAFKQGIDLIYRQLIQMLGRFGVKQIESLNHPFDPTFHEAMNQVPTTDHKP
jgi:molecular chaperone GrpE